MTLNYINYNCFNCNMNLIVKISVLLFLTLISQCLCTNTPPKEEWYPSFHLAPPSGWMNDPNGLIYWNGYYHAFYQYYPDAPQWGLMHWGHARSKDLLNWEHLPIALTPSIPEDSDGCFSGSAIDENGNLTLIYTGNNANGQVQCLATSADGINFVKEGKILDPPGGDVKDFRDPKVWLQNGSYYMVLGSRASDDHGEALLYKSTNLVNWEKDSVLAKAQDGYGYMWECPDFFPMNNKHVLTMSPQGIAANGYLYRNKYQDGHIIGTWSPGDKSFNIEQYFKLLDHGHDFYASQTFLGPDSRRIMIAWMDMWESPFPEAEQGWSGSFTIPRELELTDDGTNLRIRPIREIDALHLDEKLIEKLELNSENHVIDENVTLLDIELEWDLQNSNAEQYGIRLGDNTLSQGGVYLYVDTQANRLFLNRHYPSYKIIGYRSHAITVDNVLRVRIIFDRSSMEVFVNDGEYTMTSRIYPDTNERFLSVFAANGKAVLKSSKRWQLSVPSNKN